MKRYEEYKPVASRWTKQLPIDWDFQKIAEVFIERKESNDPIKSTDILSLTNTRGVIPYSEKGNIGNKSKSDLSGYHLAYPGDIVLNSMNMVIGSVGLTQYFGAVSPVYYVLFLRNKDANNIRYFDYVFRDKAFQGGLQGLGNGILEIRMRIPMSKLKYVCVPVPPRAEQDQIVRYLDWQVSKINRLVAAKKIQLELLEDVLLTTIQQSISLEPERDIDCLLDTVHSWIPGGWSCPLLGQLLDNIEQGWSPNAGEEVNDPDQWYVLTLSAIKHGTYYPEANKPIDIHESVPEKLEVHRGDILMTRSNTRSLVGDVCLVESSVKKLIFSDLVYRLNVRKQLVYPRYLMYYLLSSFARLQIERLAKGSSGTMPKLSHADIRRLRVILPSLEEQKLISDKLDNAVQNIRHTSKAILKQIECILEYRTRLISDVVTGQVDVRGIEVSDYESVK